MGKDFVKDAPCRDADSWLFDQMNLDLAQPALNICKRCPYWSDCEDLISPRNSYYDGICGGKVWRNGKVLARLVPSSLNQLQVGDGLETEHNETLAVRGSKLLGN